MEEERIEAVKTWLDPQSVRDIQVFLSFANFYKRFIQNFSRIAAPLTSMLQTTDNEPQSTQAENQDAPCAASGASGGGVDGNFENLSTAVKLTKSKKPKLPKANSGTDFLTSGAKEAFIHLRKAFTEAPILRHFDPGYHIRIETDASGYTIGGVLSQMTLDQHSSGHVTDKNLNPIFSNSEIGQWYLVAFFSRKMISAETWYKTHD